MATSEETKYANKVFMAGALPLLKIIANEDPKLSATFKRKKLNAVYQVSAMDEGTKHAVHFIVKDGIWDVFQGEYTGPEKIAAELAFSSMKKMNGFMKSDMKQLPSFKIKSLGKFAQFMKVLLKMSSLLTAEKPPKDVDTQRFLTKLYFCLLSTGISALNKMGHPEISKWVAESPDRTYQWTIVGDPDTSAYLRICEGNSKAGKGLYERSDPFFTMAFDCPESALLILMEIGDMFDMTANRQLIMKGGPEFGVQLGDHMTTVGHLAK